MRWLHEQFYLEAPDDFLRIRSTKGDFVMRPGAFRDDPRHDNVVGRHLPPSSAVVESFMHYFEERFRLAPLGAAARIVAIAIAHDRFNYIHPFPDGKLARQ